FLLLKVLLRLLTVLVPLVPSVLGTFSFFGFPLKFFQGFPNLFLHILLGRLYLGIGYKTLSGSSPNHRTSSFGRRWPTCCTLTRLTNYSFSSLFPIGSISCLWSFFFLFGLFKFGKINFVSHNLRPTKLLIFSG